MPLTASTVPFGRRFGVTLLAGVPGVAALAGYVYVTTPPAAVPVGLSRPLLAVLSAVTPLFLLAVACLLGAYAAPRVGLRSHLLDRTAGDRRSGPRLREEIGLAAGVGVLGAVAVVALDAATRPLLGQALPGSALGAGRPSLRTVLAYAPVRFLYGGITEELMVRFGLLSALALAGRRLVDRRADGPGSDVMWAAVVVSALLFGVGHLPALSQSVALTPAMVARTVLLNAVVGVPFGWLYWRRSLEAAMVSHAAFHVPLVALSLVQVAAL
jgi:membrane protease YdiL (CAAX protease family)